MSRARWSYMKDGNGNLIPDRPLLTALADYFNVSPDYLLVVEDTALPEGALGGREPVQPLAAAKVQSFVGQTLGDVSPATLEAVTGYLRGDQPLPPEEEVHGDCADSPDEPPVVP